MKLHEVYERRVMLFRVGGSPKDINDFMKAPTKLYGEQVDLLDNAVDTQFPFSTSLTCQPRGL